MERRTRAGIFALLMITTWAVAPAFAAGEPAPVTAPGLPGAAGGGLTIPREGLPFTAEPPFEDEIDDPPPFDDRGSAPVPGDLPVVGYGVEALPPAVRETREAIIAAARTGELETLLPLIGRTDPPPAFSSLDGSDPLDILRAESGDEEGREVLAILLDILDAGWVRVDEGTPRERYVWPYFARYPVDALDPPQMVELFRIMTAGDFEGMRAAGAYVFFRTEIAADGRWLLYMSGE
jgi:hypothetical protein